ncbi:MAG: transposase [Bacillota bacterium]
MTNDYGNKLIKYILNWKVKVNYKDEEFINKLIAENLKLKELKTFYKLFKKSLTKNKETLLKDIFQIDYESITINQFIENLKTDYKAVINSSKYIFNNGQTEGNVGKLKKIKHDMYGRGSIELLIKKVLFQSFFNSNRQF